MQENTKTVEQLADITQGLFLKAIETNTETTEGINTFMGYINQIINITLGAGAEQCYNDAFLFLSTYKDRIFARLQYLKEQNPKSPTLEIISKISAVCDIALSNSILEESELKILKTVVLYSFLFMENTNRYSYIASLRQDKEQKTKLATAKHSAGYRNYNADIELIAQQDKTGNWANIKNALVKNSCIVSIDQQIIIPLFYSDKQVALLKELEEKEKEVYVNGFTEQDLFITETKLEPIGKIEEIDGKAVYVKSKEKHRVTHRTVKKNLTKEQQELVDLKARVGKEVINCPIEPPFSSIPQNILVDTHIMDILNKEYEIYINGLYELCKHKNKNLKLLFKAYDTNKQTSPFYYLLEKVKKLYSYIPLEQITERLQEKNSILSKALPVFSRNDAPPIKYTPTDKASKYMVSNYSAYITNNVNNTFQVNDFNYTISIDKNITDIENRALINADAHILGAIYSSCIKRNNSLYVSTRDILEDIMAIKDTKGNIKADNKAIKFIENRIDNVIKYYFISVDLTQMITTEETKYNNAKTKKSQNKRLARKTELEQLQPLTRTQPLLAIEEYGIGSYESSRIYDKKYQFKYWKLSKLPLLPVIAAVMHQISNMPFADFNYRIADNKKTKGGIHRTLEQCMLKQNVYDAINTNIQMYKKGTRKDLKISYAQIIDTSERTTNDGAIKQINGKNDYTVAAKLKTTSIGRVKYNRYIKYIDIFVQEWQEVGLITSHKVEIAEVTKGRAYKEGFSFTIDYEPPKKANKKQATPL